MAQELSEMSAQALSSPALQTGTEGAIEGEGRGISLGAPRGGYVPSG